MLNPIDMRHALYRLITALFSLLIFASIVPAQTLVTYGNQTIGKDDFLKAYRKNNSGGKPTEKSYRDYLELYTRYKLKVKEAYELRLDTLPTLITELQNFRNQVADSYMNDAENLDKLTKEAFDRSQKDIHIAQIFVSIPLAATPEDTLRAYQKLLQAYGELKKGKDFAKVADTYSDDPFVKTNHGDISYVTAFSLPYELENLAYTTPPGKFSAPYRGKNGYHILKNLGERKALGRIRAAQILLIFPVNGGDAGKAETKQRADSIYRVLKGGGDFSELAKKFSGDNISYMIGGQMPEFGVGRYDPVFENAAFSLAKDGELGEPVMTSFGYHIIKRLSRRPVSTVATKSVLDGIKQQVMNDSRIEASRKAMDQKIMKVTGFAENKFNENELWICTDSMLLNKKQPVFPDLDGNTVLFSFAKKKVTVRDWLTYRSANRSVYALTKNKTNRTMLDDFEKTSAHDYYRAHLEDYNADFAYQYQEFKDGNLLFEIMQRKVWDRATSDTAGLQEYYDAHKNKYWWEPSADAILFTCNSERTAEDVKKKIKNIAESWRSIADSSNGLVQTDSGRFELAQLPAAETGKWQSGQFSSMQKNTGDNNILIAFVVKTYSDRAPRTYHDAKGLVINDYQSALEEKWVAGLKQKYPVTVQQAVVKTLPK